MTNEEHDARAMLLGLRHVAFCYVEINPKNWARRKIYHRDTLKLLRLGKVVRRLIEETIEEEDRSGVKFNSRLPQEVTPKP